MGPLIGIPQRLDDRGRWRAGRTYQYLEITYASAGEEAGGTPVYLPVQADVLPLVERIDGLLLPGGGDFPPEHAYPEAVRFAAVSPRQLEFDQRLLAAARERRLPILGICYGMQLLALESGGALLYDIATDAPDAGSHRLPEPEGRHPIEVEPGSRLAAILGPGADAVNSRHHQAVADAGDLIAVARSPDGLIEAVEAAGDDFLLGVQWHPERLGEPHGARLLRAFVNACGAR